MPSPNTIHVCIFADERSIHTRRWIKALREAGHKVDLVTLIKDPDHDVGGIDLGATTKIEYFTKIWALRNLVRKLNPDIFHAHMATSFGFLASFVDHPRKILSVWGDDVVVSPTKNYIFKLMILRAIKKAHYITATSHFLKEAVIHLAKTKNEIRVVPFGIDLDFLRPVERNPKSVIRIGIVKWLTPKYGIDVLIRAFDQILHAGHNAELFIAGRGPKEEEYKAIAAKLGRSDSIFFCGYLDHADLPKFLASLDIFVMPSISDGESFGVAALEASATCLPVVATKVGGVPEVVIDGQSGILVERGDINRLASAIIKLIENPDLRGQMGLAGRKLVERNYRWEDNVNAMIDLYRETMK